MKNIPSILRQIYEVPEKGARDCLAIADDCTVLVSDDE